MEDSNFKDVVLFESETGYFFMVSTESITTITQFRGKAPLHFLKSRVRIILQLNPWLTGRLIRKDGLIYLRYSELILDDRKTPNFFIEQEKNIIKSDEELKTLKHLCQFKMKRGDQAINQDVPLFQITVVERDEDNFFLVVSLSHVIADGCTYYKIYKMLSREIEPSALIVERNMEFYDEMEKRLKPTKSLLKSTPAVANFLIRFILAKKVTIRRHCINLEWINEQKQKYLNSLSDIKEIEENPKFISTNDLITSEFFKSSSCDVGLMAVNFRDRINGLTADYAGNYEGLITFTPENYRKPQSIRKGIPNDSENKKEILPGFLDRLFAKCGLISNWSSFFHVLDLEDCQLLHHEPIYEKKYQAFDWGIIYQFNRHKLALLTLETEVPLMDYFIKIGAVFPDPC